MEVGLGFLGGGDDLPVIAFFLHRGLLRGLNGRLGSLTLFPACNRFALFRGRVRLESGFRLGWGGGFHYPPPGTTLDHSVPKIFCSA
jgi:hypothetical protein